MTQQDVRCGFADVLHTQQRVDGVVAAEDARGEDDGEGVGRHPVGLLLEGDPETRRRRNSSLSIPTPTLADMLQNGVRQSRGPIETAARPTSGTRPTS